MQGGRVLPDLPRKGAYQADGLDQLGTASVGRSLGRHHQAQVITSAQWRRVRALLGRYPVSVGIPAVGPDSALLRAHVSRRRQHLAGKHGRVRNPI